MESRKAEKYTVLFADGEVTNTRLMGALGMHVHWQLINQAEETFDLHQFIRYDVDLKGIEFLAVAKGDDREAVASAIHEYFGPLGGTMVSLTERQCRFLGNWFLEQTEAAGHTLPDDARQLDFFSSRKVSLSAVEMGTLVRKICVNIETEYGLVNYFLMRTFAKDAAAAAWLTADNLAEGSIENLAFPRQSELVKNTIEEFSADEKGTVYMCEAVAAIGDVDYLVICEILVKDSKVVGASKKLVRKLSPFEGALIINRSEYIRVFDINMNEKSLRRELKHLVGNGMNFDHAAGELFMALNDNNNHAEERVFRISGDVSVMYFITNAGQLLMVGSNQESVFNACLNLHGFIVSGDLTESGLYHMDPPVFSDFIDSDFDDFDEYLSCMQQ